MSDIAIEIRDLCIDYIPYKKTTIRKSFFKRKHEKLDIINAVSNVSFSLEKGKILGIVGKNGSGKSTLLKSIAGIFKPDSGEIDLHGNSVSLLAIGVGFVNELSGRENIFLSGMLLGFSEEEINERVDEIIEFSELGKFIDYPVRTYSSGMHSKLAFAISSTLETDIILIDEVLSVGDSRFKKKSYQRMKELISNKDKTVLIVSHDSKTLLEVCDSVLWIDEGKVRMSGEPEETINQYEEYMEKK